MTKISSYSVDLNKALAFVFISILITSLSIWLFIVPMMRDYKISKITNRHAKIKFNQANKYHDEVIEKLKVLKSENKNQIETLRTPWDNKNFKVTTSKYMSNINIKYATAKDYDLYYTKRDINITGIIPMPKNLFNTVISLNKYRNMISINFPIKLESIENSRELKVTYPLKLYQIKEGNSTKK